MRVGDRLPSTRSLAARSRREQDGDGRGLRPAARRGLGGGQARGGDVRGGGAAERGADRAVRRTPRDRRGPGHGRGRAGRPRAGMPCVEVLDRAAWRRAWRAAADEPPDIRPDPVGLPAFRAAVVEHLLRHRGLPADPGTVLATGGTRRRSPSWPGSCRAAAAVAVEEPGYQRAVEALRGRRARGGPGAGGRRRAGRRRAARRAGRRLLHARAPVPAGRAAVGGAAAWRWSARARTEGFLVVEDDYDGELRYDVAPLPLLAALVPDVVVHLGTASKLLTPTLGVGWLVGPPDVCAVLVRQRDRAGVRPARAGQRVFAELAAHGDLARHLRRLRRELAERRRAVRRGGGGRGPAGPGRRGGGARRGAAGVGVGGGVGARDGRGGRGGPGRPVAPPRRVPTEAGMVLGYAGPTRAELDRALPVVSAVLRAAG